MGVPIVFQPGEQFHWKDKERSQPWHISYEKLNSILGWYIETTTVLATRSVSIHKGVESTSALHLENLARKGCKCTGDGSFNIQT